MTDERKKGRPTKYRPEFAEQAEKLCRLGATNIEIADFFGVAVSCVHRWCDAHPEFRDALKRGKDDADANVEQSLYRKALGYSHPDTHVSNYQGDVTITPITKHYPPDTTACIFWLKNRQPGRWRDKQEHEVSGKDGGPVQVETSRKPVLNFDAVMARLKALDVPEITE